jgi:hypothetical protein
VSLKSVYKTLQSLREQLTNNQFSRTKTSSIPGNC